MGWTRKSCRATLRLRRPDLEALEPRTLLSIVHSHLAVRHGHPAVAALHSLPSPTATSLNSSAPAAGDLIGAALTRSNFGVDGTGMTVAVIDTGVNYAHEALGGGIGSGHKVVTGYDFTQNSSDPQATSSQHGTAVAGLIASSDPNYPGVAPGADIAALKVFSSSNQGNFQYVAEALQWVIDHHAQYGITAVNLSMADGNTYAQNWFAQDGGIGQKITTLIGQLDALNIPVIAATGNSFNGQQGVGFPAIVPDTISVTSTNASGTVLSSDAQRVGPAIGGASATDIAAPGEGLVAPVQGNQFATVDGTSFAAAEVSGAVVLLQQIYEQRFGQLPTVDQIDTWLQEGSDPVSDPVTDLAIGRLDIPKAASFIPNPQVQAQILAPSTSPTTPAVAPAVSTLSTWTTSADNTGTSTSPAPYSVNPTQPPQQSATSSLPSSSNSTGGTADASQATTAPTVPTGSTGTTSTQAGASSPFAAAFNSLKAWGMDTGGGAQIWSNINEALKTLGSSQPTGKIKLLLHGTRTHSPRVPSGPNAGLGHSPFVRGWHRG
jgi:type VI secretion system secreted protein VgrG